MADGMMPMAGRDAMAMMPSPAPAPTAAGLFETTKAKRHGHMVYMRPDGSCVCGESNGHTHDCDGMTCAPAKDGHAHDVIPLQPKSKKAKKDDSERVDHVKGLWKAAMELETASRKKGVESKKFLKGEQWDEQAKRELESKQRACLTINEIESKIDILSGYQRQNRSDIHYLPVEDGDARIADVLNAVVKNVCEQNLFEHEETKVFEDEMVVGRGLFHVFLDYDANIDGDIRIEQFPWDECFFGPHQKEDLSDCEYLAKTKWYSRAKLKSLWPEKADEIQKEFDDYLAEGTHLRRVGDQYSVGEGKPGGESTAPDGDFVNLAKKEFRVVECWEREWDKVPVLVNADDDFYLNGSTLDAAQVASAKSIPGMRVVPRRVAKMRKTVIASSTLLSDEYDDTYGDVFPVVPVYAKKDGADWWGKVEAVKDPQREVNKRASQTVDIINKNSSYGWFYDADTFPTLAEEKSFKDRSSSPGFLAKVNSTRNIPVKAEGVKFPGEIVQLGEMASLKIREIMNVNAELIGINSKSESGVAIVEKKHQALIGNEFLFDNLNLAKRVLGRLLVRLIQKTYTPERIMRILGNRNERTPVELGGVPMEDNDPNEIIALLRETDLTKYDVVVDESARSPTNRRANFIAWAEMAKQGFPVPPDVLIDLSDLPDKDKIKKSIADAQKAAADMEQRKMDTEIQKTLISANSKNGGDSPQSVAPPGAMPMGA